MKKYTVDEPEFNKTLIITETTDTGHADNINKAPKMAFENTLYLEKTKLDADGGDISEAVIKAADEIEDDEYPIPASGDKPRTFLGKTKKFLGNIKDWMTGVCLLGQIVNNCVTDNAKLPLSAAQGKALMDLYNVLNTKSLSTHYEHYKTDETKDNFIVSLPIGVHFFSVQNVHSEFAYDTGKNIWGFGTMLVFGIMSGYRAILYVTAHGELYIRHYVSNTPHVGWIKIK